ncbi:MAG: molecular chaperone TorD family protein [Deltaproteobacteria bacterium]|nr:molecular chaperone TorD family protein [Deltaproteobacteria bacterium]
MQTRSEAVGRAVLYGSLSKLLLPPDEETAGAIRCGRIGDELEAALAILPGAPRGRAERIWLFARDTEDPEARYFRAFDHALVGTAPPFETEYSGSEPFLRTNDLGDVAGFYSAWGLRARGVKERPDHIGVEAEFMSFLAQKEAAAPDLVPSGIVAPCEDSGAVARRASAGGLRPPERGGVRGGASGSEPPPRSMEDLVGLCTRAADRFLVEHLGGFAPFYAERFARAARDALYVEVVRLLADVVTWDMKRRGIEAEHRHRSAPVVVGVAGGEA